MSPELKFDVRETWPELSDTVGVVQDGVTMGMPLSVPIDKSSGQSVMMGFSLSIKRRNN